MKKRQIRKLPKRGEIWLVNFDPSIGVEIKKTRPALIIQNNAGNFASEATIVAAITSSQRLSRSFEVKVNTSEGGLKKNSLILLQQIRTIDKRRLVRRLGRINGKTLEKAEIALKISLDLGG